MMNVRGAGVDLNELSPDAIARARADFVKVSSWRMPFGKYQGRLLIELPEEYLLWFRQRGFPAGELGRILRLVLELKTDGVDGLCRPATGPGRCHAREEMVPCQSSAKKGVGRTPAGESSL